MSKRMFYSKNQKQQFDRDNQNSCFLMRKYIFEWNNYYNFFKLPDI